MAQVWWPLTIRDGGSPVELLTPTFVHFTGVPALTPVAPQPTIQEIGDGDYGFLYDPEVGGNVQWQIDAGAAVPNAGDRFVSGFCGTEPSRINSAIADSGAVQADAVVGATAVTLPTGKPIQPGTIIVVERGTGLGSSFVVDTYVSGTGVTTPTLPIDADLNGTSADPAVRSRYLALPGPRAAQLPNVDAGNQVVIAPTSTTTQMDSIEATLGVPALTVSDDIAAITPSDPAAVADAVWDEVRAGHLAAGSFGESLVDTVGSRATPAQVRTEADAALVSYDAPTFAELAAVIAGLNDLSAAEVNAEVDLALADYDAPTKAELDAGLATIPTSAQIAATVLLELVATHSGTPGSLAAVVAGVNTVVTALQAAVALLNTDDVAVTSIDVATLGAIADKVLARNRNGGADGGDNIALVVGEAANRIVTASGISTVYDDDGITPLKRFLTPGVADGERAPI